MKKKRPVILLLTFWQLIVNQYSFDRIQVKLNLISNIKNTIYELTHELSNDYRLPISRNFSKISKLVCAQSDVQFRNMFLRLLVKSWAKADIKIVWSGPNLLWKFFEYFWQCIKIWSFFEKFYQLSLRRAFWTFKIYE